MGAVDTVCPLSPRLLLEMGLDKVFEGPDVRTTESNILSNLPKNFLTIRLIGL